MNTQLCEIGLELITKNSSPDLFELAVTRGNLVAVKALLAAGANLHALSSVHLPSILKAAYKHGDVEFAKTLVLKGSTNSRLQDLMQVCCINLHGLHIELAMYVMGDMITLPSLSFGW